MATDMKMKGGKAVAFMPTTTIVNFHDSSSSETRWLTVAERRRLIGEARDQAKDWSMKEYDFLLKNTYKDPCADAQDKLDAYIQLEGGDYCRGLERFVCKQHGALRDAFKKGVVKAVVSRQTKLRQAGMSPEEIYLNLGAYSTKITSPSAAFAQRLGKADELVVRQGEDSLKVKYFIAPQVVVAAKETSEMLKLMIDSESIMRDCSDRSVMAVNSWHRDSLSEVAPVMEE